MTGVMAGAWLSCRPHCRAKVHSHPNRYSSARQQGRPFLQSLLAIARLQAPPSGIQTNLVEAESELLRFAMGEGILPGANSFVPGEIRCAS
jgi:hypothetical protein